MNEQLRFAPPDIDFDARLANELARHERTVPATSEPAHPIIERRSPFSGYARMLTPEGGILILYTDQNRSLLVTVLRVVACILVSWIGLWLIFAISLSALQFLFAVALLILINWAIIQFKVKASHSVEIRPEAMIIDGEDVFYAEDIGDNWPELQVQDGGDPDCMVICGICGTRFVEYMIVNRYDKNDRTPEVLAADLKAAFEQLWGRREVTFATAF
jgi:hypothetical protein